MEHTPLLKMYPSNPPIVRILYRFCLIKNGATPTSISNFSELNYFLVICTHKRCSMLGMESPLSRVQTTILSVPRFQISRDVEVAGSTQQQHLLVSPLSPSQFCSLQLRGSRRFLGVTSIQEQAPKICKLLQKALNERRNRLNHSKR